MNRLLNLVLYIANSSDGIILIDEIENGLHYSVMEGVWRAIGKAARDFDVQIFATTHSLECIRAAHRAFSEGDQYDFRLHRLERVGGKIEAVTYDQKALDISLEQGWEVR
jgi:AAA15 family ATPase/GTPase